MKRCIYGLPLLLITYGAAAGPRYQTVRGHERVEKEITTLFEAGPAATHGLQMVMLDRSETQSVHIVRVRTEEEPHMHAVHDSTILIQEGHGAFHVDGKLLMLGPGDIAAVPRGTPHYFVNLSTGGFCQALVVFSPPYDGTDRVPVPGFK